MRTEYEAVPMTVQEHRRIDKLATELLSETLDRAGAAAIIRTHGFAAYVGGHHVAIHRKVRGDEIHGDRLAIVTDDSLDWL